VNTPALIYCLCLAASFGCAALLWRAYGRSRSRLIFWTAVSFCFFALNNLVLVADVLVFQATDLWIWRQAATAIALAVLIFGFVWQTR
jgi:hypothetical protein